MTPKQISIIGGHGQIARHLTRKLVERGHGVRGLVRSADQFDDLHADGAEPVLCDLEAASESDIDAALTGSDVVVFAAGAGPDSGTERKKSLDRDGAIKSVESAVRVGSERFVIISSMGADDPPTDDEGFSVYLRAKHDADVAVRETSDGSDLTYTVVRPGKLTDDEPTGSVQLAEHADRASIPRSDVAEVLAELIDSEHGNGSTFEVVSGPTSIADAVRSLD
ncbi:MAG: SDR family oxidoreductase [Ilumatobacter sp.]|uniref:SDR family oxidoreductase n=1 Tax=Ilumatobacter sp. TaxID=1967498 RepID=UPI003C743BA2